MKSVRLWTFATVLVMCFTSAIAEAAETCMPLSRAKKDVADNGGILVPMTTRELNFVRGVYFVTPPASTHLPPGGAGLWVLMDGQKRFAVFVDGERVCGSLNIPPQLLPALGELDQQTGDAS